MKKVNIVFDGLLEDVDIISVPDEIVHRMEEIGQEFLCWVATTTDSDYLLAIEGKSYAVAETDGFIKWLNTYYCKNMDKAKIVIQHTNYCPQYLTIEF